MKKFLFILGMVAMMSACAGYQKADTAVSNDSIEVVADSIAADSVMVADSTAVDSLIVE